MSLKPFSHYEERTLTIINGVLNSQELENLSFEELDLLQGQVLIWLIRTGAVTDSSVRACYFAITQRSEP